VRDAVYAGSAEGAVGTGVPVLVAVVSADGIATIGRVRVE